MKKWLKTSKNGSKFFLGCNTCKNFCNFFYFWTFSFWYFHDPVFMVNYNKTAKNWVLKVPKGKSWKIKKSCKSFYLTCVTPQKNLDPFLPVFSHFFMFYFDILGSIFEKCPMTYNFCMIPHPLTFSFIFGHFGLKQNPTGL